MSIKITIPANALKDLLNQQLAQWASAGQALTADAAQKLQDFVDQITPLAEQEIEAKLNGDPHSDQYLAILAGAEEANAAQLAVEGLQLSAAQARATISAVVSASVMFLRLAAMGFIQAAIPGGPIIAGAVAGVVNAAAGPATVPTLNLPQIPA